MNDRRPEGNEDPAIAEEGLTESDQTLADNEQTLADRDQTASDRDQQASDDDQAASDRHRAEGGEWPEYASTTASRGDDAES